MAFFFSSRRRHTRYWRDWSSDVCSSDLAKRVPHLSSKSALLSLFRVLLRLAFTTGCGAAKLSYTSSRAVNMIPHMGENKRRTKQTLDEDLSRDRSVDGKDMNANASRDRPVGRLTVPEAADMTGVTQSAIRKRVHRGTI